MDGDLTRAPSDDASHRRDRDDSPGCLHSALGDLISGPANQRIVSGSRQNHAMSKAREFISPSDLTFSWNGCHRCLWLNYNHGVKAPSFMPLVGELSAMQENHFNGAISSQLHPEIKEGEC